MKEKFLLFLFLILLSLNCDNIVRPSAYLIVRNEESSGVTIHTVYIRRSFEGNDWGKNLLDNTSIKPNYQKTFEVEAGFSYDYQILTTGEYQIIDESVFFGEGRHQQWTFTSTGYTGYYWYD